VIVIHSDHRRCSRCRCFKERGCFHAKARNRDGSIRQWQSHCKDCQRESSRMNGGITRRGRPYGPRRRARTPEQQRRARRRQRRIKQRRETAEQRTTRLVLARIDARLRRGATLQYAPRREWRDGVGVVEPYRPTLAPSEWLDPTPFVDWIEEFYAGARPERIARALGVTPCTVRALLGGDQHGVSLKLVDRVVTGLGRPDLLNSLYPLDVS
jgi:hypothetical protein